MHMQPYNSYHIYCILQCFRLTITEQMRWRGGACLLELGGAEVDLVGGVLLLQHLLEGVVGGVRLAVQVTLIKVHMSSGASFLCIKSVVHRRGTSMLQPIISIMTRVPQDENLIYKDSGTLACHVGHEREQNQHCAVSSSGRMILCMSP